MQNTHNEKILDVAGVILAGRASAGWVGTRPACLLVRQHGLELTVEELIARECREVDLVLTEGLKQRPLPKIEGQRQQLGASLLCRGKSHDPTLVAVASDVPFERDVPLFDRNSAIALADFLERRYLL